MNAGHFVHAIATDGTHHRLVCDSATPADAMHLMECRLAYRGLTVGRIVACRPVGALYRPVEGLS